jgi:hypothetical protein
MIVTLPLMRQTAGTALVIHKIDDLVRAVVQDAFSAGRGAGLQFRARAWSGNHKQANQRSYKFDRPAGGVVGAGVPRGSFYTETTTSARVAPEERDLELSGCWCKKTARSATV